MSLRPLLQIATESDSLRSLRDALGERGEAPVDAYVSAALRPYLLASLLELPDGPGSGPALIVAADDRSARDLASDLLVFLAPREVHLYPSRGTTYESHLEPPPHLAGLRVAALDALATSSPVVVASAIALAEAVPDPSLRPDSLALHLGESVDLGDVSELLADSGYERVEQVEERGQFAVRGGILDVYPATEERAVRVELFGDEIDSIRWFSVFTQRSLGDAERVELAPAAELAAEHRGEVDSRGFRAPLDLVPADALVVIAAAEEIPGALRDRWEDVLAAVHEDEARQLYVDVAEPLAERAALSLGADSGQRHSFRAQRAEFPSRTLAEAESELERLLRSGYRTVVAFESRGEAERARYNLARLDAGFLADEPPAERSLSFAEARLREGFLAPELELAVIPQRRLIHRRRAAPQVSARAKLAAAVELRVGDYVVH
ncbi:MAG: transcription-repair coupling factor, partial [Solirubrobacterales bacterium]